MAGDIRVKRLRNTKTSNSSMTGNEKKRVTKCCMGAGV